MANLNDYKKKFFFWSTLKYLMMFGVPIISSLILWGIVGEPTNNTPSGKLALGIFIAGFLVVIFLSDFIKAQFEQMKMDKRVAMTKNRAFEFAIIAIMLIVVRRIADDAILFCEIGAGSHAIAFGLEIVAKYYYRKWKPL